jgi:YYY domain-containing protein
MDAIAGQIAIWWLAIQLIGLAALPITAFLFRHLPDRGYAFAKSFGLLLVGYLAWMISMLGLGMFRAPLIALCGIVVLGAGIAIWHFVMPRTNLKPDQFIPRWPTILGYEVLFLLLLVGCALLRSYNPNPWGTERPMDFALFNAIQRSTLFPPHDPWLAGYSINYYYFGYLLMASLNLLTGTLPEVGYNLSLAMLFALTGIGLAGLLNNLLGLARQTAHPTERSVPRIATTISSTLVVMLAVSLVLLAGNQAGALQIASGSRMIMALETSDALRAINNGLGPREPLALQPPFNGQDFDKTEQIVPVDAWSEFDWWHPSRALWDTVPPQNPGELPYRRYSITEFPFFSFWLGDMHPHVMSLPFLTLMLAATLQLFARPTPLRLTFQRMPIIDIVLTSLIVGSLYVINSWDFPTGILLVLGALTIRYVQIHGGADWRTWLRPWLLTSGLIGGLAVALFGLFYLTFTSLVGAKPPLIDLPLIGGLTRTLGVVWWDKTSLYEFLTIFGLFGLPLLALVMVLPREAPTSTSLWDRLLAPGVVVLATLIIGVLLGFPLLALLPLGSAVTLLASRQTNNPAQSMALWGFAVGCFICFGTEIVYLRDVFENRMNTIFKFYYQVWLIWGALAAYALWAISQTLLRGPGMWQRLVAGIALPLACFLLAGGLIYPWQTAGRQFQDGTPIGLAGRTPRQASADGAAAITWLRENTRGDEVLLEYGGNSYDVEGQGGSGVSASTGMATVIGWHGHQTQWRGGDIQMLEEVDRRRRDMLAFFNGELSDSDARTMLQRYSVDLIYVGEFERSAFPPEALAKISGFGQPVFERPLVTIYQVTP